MRTCVHHGESVTTAAGEEAYICTAPTGFLGYSCLPGSPCGTVGDCFVPLPAAESEVARLRRDLRDSQNYRIEAAHDRGIEIEGLREEVARLRGLLGECAGWIGDTCDVIGMSDTRLNAARVLLRRLAAALEEEDHG